MAHFSVWQRSPLRNNFIPSRRHNRQTGPIYLAIRFQYLPQLKGAVYGSRAFVLLCFTPMRQTRRRFGGRQPLCGIGVRSLIDFTSIPAVAKARTADSRPAPGPLTLTSTDRRPYSFALLAAVKDACWAANGVPFLDPRNPSEPELDQASTLPIRSVKVTIVLLNEAWICTKPVLTIFFSFFLNVFFFVAGFAGALAILILMSSLSPSSYRRWWRGADPCACAHWCVSVDRGQGARGGAGHRDRNPFQ